MNNLLPAKAIRRLFDIKSDMTLWRWLNDETLGFPRPIVIRSRRYWDANDIEAFRLQLIERAISKHAVRSV